MTLSPVVAAVNTFVMKSLICLLGLLTLASAKDPATLTHIRPGEIWPDTDGKPINAHGGGILFHEGTYYWYGEIKQGKTYLPEVNKSWGGTRVDVVGVSC